MTACSSSVRAFLSLDSSRQSTATDDGSDEAYSSQVRVLVYVAAIQSGLRVDFLSREFSDERDENAMKSL